MKNIGVAGMGYWGRNLVRNFHELGALRMVCDESSDREKTVREQYPDTDFCCSFTDLLGHKDIKAVALATPACTHFDLALQALRAGKDVFVEKPLALTISEGKKLLQCAAENQRILMVGHILRYHPAVIQLKELISNGELGRIQYLYSNRLNMGKIRTEENILWSFAPHDISVMLALLDEEPCDVTCRGSGYLNQEVADVTLSEFLFPSGVRAHIFVSWLHPFKEQRLVVVGSTKMAVFDDRAEDKLVLYPHKVEWKNRAPVAIKAEAEKVDVPEAEPLKQECAHFIACIQERQTPVTDGQEGLRVLSVLNACQHSLEESHRTPLSPADTAAPDFFVHPTAVVDPGSEIGTGTKIWHFTHIMKGARIGRRCIIGQNVNVDSGTFIGNNVKIQNNVSVYTGCEIEDDVFLGPSCVMTNITNPRSQVNRRTLYEKTYIRRGATIGANATLVCGIDIGRYAFIAAGAVVTKDVPDYALMMGNPARQQGWMSRHGHRLSAPGQDGIMVCPESGCRYRETESGILRCLDLDENTPLPESLAAGTRSYDDFKRNPCNPEEGVT